MAPREAGTPVIGQAAGHECEVTDNYKTETFDNFICKIANTYIEEEMLNIDGKVIYNKLKPVLLRCLPIPTLRTGEMIGKCTMPRQEIPGGEHVIQIVQPD